MHIVKDTFVIVLFFFAGVALAQEGIVDENRPDNTIFFSAHLDRQPTSAPWLSALPDANEDVGTEDSAFEHRFTKLVFDHPKFQVYFVSPNDECKDGVSRMYLHPAAKFVDYGIPVNCPEPEGVYPEDVGFAIYEFDSRILIEVGWGEPAGPKYRLLEVTETEIVEVACNDC